MNFAHLINEDKILAKRNLAEVLHGLTLHLYSELRPIPPSSLGAYSGHTYIQTDKTLLYSIDVAQPG